MYIILGIFVVLIPLLGLPNLLRTILLVLAGGLISVTAFFNKKMVQGISNNKKEAKDIVEERDSTTLRSMQEFAEDERAQ